MNRIFSKSTLPALCMLAIGAPAVAELATNAPTTPAAQPSNWTMSFLASPAIEVGGYPSYPHVVQVRNNDTTNVIVHQPVACGDRLRDASFEIEGKYLLLRYSAPYAGGWDSPCVSTGMFVFHGLPGSNLEIVALPEPMSIAALVTPAQTLPWTMSFLASPAIAVSGYASYPHVVQVRSNDATNVIVHQPVACGERLRDASFEVEGEFLLLRYSAPYVGGWDSPCISTGMFTFRGLVSRDIQIVALPEPLQLVNPVAKLEGPSVRMGFLSSPAIAHPGYPSYPHVVQVRNNDITNVIVHQPVACGERLRDASFEQEGEYLLLRYSAPYAGKDSPCISTGMFTFRGLPAGNIQVLALPEPLPVATMARK